MNLRKLTILFAAFLMVTSLGLAQSKDYGTFIGAVYSTEGTPLPGVSITAKNLDMGLSQSTITNDQGFYRIERLPRIQNPDERRP